MSITKSELMKLQNGSDVRGIACEGIEGEHVTLTSEAAYLIGRGLTKASMCLTAAWPPHLPCLCLLFIRKPDMTEPA